MLKLEALQARHGDCLLLFWGDEAKPSIALIDGGPSKTYKDVLKPRLVELADKRSNGVLPLDLVMLSHIDDDHIKGLLDFAEEVEQEELKVKVKQLWHNSLEGLLNDDLTAPVAKASLASVAGAVASWGPTGSNEHYRQKVVASVPQGQELHGYATRLKWPRNSKFKSGLVMRGEKAKAFSGLKITPICPGPDELTALQVDWAEKRKNIDTALAAYKDRSVYNLSSIVALVEYEGKRILFTGDARGDHILEGLNALSLLEEDAPFFVDVLKLPHHGSNNNVEKEFYQRVIANHYVVSGDRVRFPNPAQDSMKWLKEARGSDDYVVYCTYAIPELKRLFGERWVAPKKNATYVEVPLA